MRQNREVIKLGKKFAIDKTNEKRLNCLLYNISKRNTKITGKFVSVRFINDNTRFKKNGNPYISVRNIIDYYIPISLVPEEKLNMLQ